MVSDLIDSDLRCWKRDLISNCFGPVTCSQICSIPLSWSSLDDTIIWHAEKDGTYSVKSAYHILRAKRDARDPGPSSRSQSRIWKQIWNAPIHTRVRNFLWRLVKDILPIRVNLVKKGVKTALDCPLCQENEETVDHLFFHCQLSRMVWFLSPLGLRIDANASTDSWLEKVLCDGDVLGSQIFCVTLWKIWHHRNMVIFNNGRFDPQLVAEEAKDWVLDFNKSNPVQKPSRSQQDLVKEDDIGNDLVRISVDAEAYAIRWALSIARSLSIHKIIILSDALLVVDSINQVSTVAVLEPYVVDCQVLLSSFSESTVIFVRRDGNHDAHQLVGLGHNLGARSWLGFPSSSEKIGDEAVQDEGFETNLIRYEDMELNISLVSELIESGKTTFKDLRNEFEEKLIM
ncbi:uncharacterized protein LOC131596977 [Vicia villosa]|uniref:uncharacterized protein LOC131596977 n=1 Tax=Vicia villosa TaxID=3911 RepID=UPI00273AD28F|nr:uncharacterized protein LOC131596977 [Vicia villosa]